MSFTAPSYLPFWLAVFLCFYFSPDRYRWLVLLLSSVVFYATLNVPSLFIALAAVTILTYVSGRAIHAAVTPRRKSQLFWAGVVADVAILAGFRYTEPILFGLNALSDQLLGHEQPFAIVRVHRGGALSLDGSGALRRPLGFRDS